MEASKTRKLQWVFIIIAALMFSVIVVRLGYSSPQETGTDYSALIVEYAENSKEWKQLETEQKLLEKRNAEIRSIVCESGVCDFH